MRPGWVIFATFACCAALGAMLIALDPPSVPEAPSALLAPSAADSAPETAATEDSTSPSAAAPARPAPSAKPSGPCATDMVLVEGFHCPFVAHVCKKRKPGARGACDAFEPRVLCEGTLRKKRFCVDRFEYPNLEGALPAVLVDWDEAKRACAAEDKRLCTVDEWQLACEGEAILPYTTGVLRTKGDCNWDARAETPVIPTRGLGVATDLARLDGRVPSGSLARCASPFGVHDMGGNVAEWVDDPTGSLKRAPFASVVAGGAFGASEGTCRAVDADGAPSQRASTIGFRCCADPEGLPVPGDKRKAKGGFQPLATAPGLP